MLYEVPFVPDPAYGALLAGAADRLAGVYFRLGPETPDARMPGLADPSPMELAAGLSGLPPMPRLGLLNAAFHAHTMNAVPDANDTMTATVRRAAKLRHTSARASTTPFAAFVISTLALYASLPIWDSIGVKFPSTVCTNSRSLFSSSLMSAPFHL